MNSSAEQPGQEPADKPTQAQDETAGSPTPGLKENSQADAAVVDAPSGDEIPPTAPRTTDAEGDGIDGAEGTLGSAAEETPPAFDEEAITRRLFGAVAEWLRERPSDARLAGRDYHEHRVVFNLSAPESGKRVEIVGYELSRRTCAAIQNVFVKPDGYDDAHARLGKRRLLFLSGRPQVGKGTAANYLALSYAGETGIEERPRKIVRLEPTTPLAALHRFDFKQDTAYVIDGLAPRHARELDPFHLELVEQRLHETHAYLVVSVDDGSLPRLVAREGYELDWNHAPDLTLVLRRHAIIPLGDMPEQRETVRAWLDNPKVVAVLPELRTPQDSVELAAELVRVACDDKIAADAKLDNALDRHGAQTAAEAVAGFDEAGPEKRAWLLALASLDDCAYSTVVEASERLWERLTAPSVQMADDEQHPVERPELRQRRRSEILKELGAETFSAYVPHAHGYAKAVRVRLHGAGTGRAILRHAWEEHDALRQPILAWLEELVVERPDIGWEVARTLGLLGTFDFSYLLAKVFNPWIGEDLQHRAAVAAAVGWSARDESQRQQVTALLRYWVTEGNTRERWTAAMACGSVFGMTYPDEALDALRQIAETNDLMLRHVVPRSVVSLFAAGSVEPELHLKALRALEGWTTDRLSPAADTGRRAFLQLVKVGQLRQARVWLAIDDSACVVPLARLWRRLLDTPAQRRDALVALGQAFEEADRNPGLADKLVALVKEMVLTARRDERARLRYQLATWSYRRRAPSTTARRCLGLIPAQ
jgi:hypothetical protein